jgi:hypothetical protein
MGGPNAELTGNLTYDMIAEGQLPHAVGRSG